MSDNWNEALRGPKMSTDAGRIIFKYQMPVLEDFVSGCKKTAKRFPWLKEYIT